MTAPRASVPAVPTPPPGGAGGASRQGAARDGAANAEQTAGPRLRSSSGATKESTKLKRGSGVALPSVPRPAIRRTGE